MKFSKLTSLKNGNVIRQLAGRIVRVYDPRPPSAAQERAGFHTQSILLQDDDGASLLLRLQHSFQHINGDAKGCMYQFQSTSDDRGNLNGLVVNRYVADDGEERMTVDVNKHANFYRIDEPSSSSGTPDESSPPAPPATKPKPVITVGGLVGLYANILTEMELQMGGTELFTKLVEQPKAITSVAGCVFIEACRHGLAKAPPLPETVGMDAATPAEKATSAIPETHTETPASITSVEDLADYIATGGSDDALIRESRRKLNEKSKLSFSMLFDNCYERLPKTYTDQMIEAAWDEIAAELNKDADGNPKKSKVKNEDICEFICTQWATFIGKMDMASKQAKAA